MVCFTVFDRLPVTEPSSTALDADSVPEFVQRKELLP